MKNTLIKLVEDHTVIKKDGFSIYINEETDLWNKCIASLGRKQAYHLMAQAANELYRKRSNEDFIYSDDCMAYEIGYHADAYFKLLGYKGYHRHFLTYLLFKNVVLERCEAIDISIYDMRSFIQRTVFKYKKGIRACYKGTDRDPYK